MATAIRDGLARIGVKALSVGPGSPWENGYIQSFSGKPRDKLLNGEVFETMLEAPVLARPQQRFCQPPVNGDTLLRGVGTAQPGQTC